MKPKFLGMLTALISVSTVSIAQEFTDKISRELTFEKPTSNTVMIFNVNGAITVLGYEGSKVIVEATRTIKGKTDRRLELGKEAVRLGVQDRADTILLYTEGTCSMFGQQRSRRNNNGNRKTNYWGYLWNDCENRNNCKEEYDYVMDYVVRVPSGVNLYASTINNGDIKVENVTGTVFIDNINGSISLQNIAGATDASTINGTVDLTYTRNPPRDSRYYSLNGDINAFFRKGLTAMLSFESFNGDLYTNIAQVENIPITVEKRPQEKGIKYKVLANRYKIGNGGVNLDFETFNGNVYLKEQ